MTEPPINEDYVFDTRAPGVLADPYPAFRRLRAEDPVHWSPALKGWVLTRYADVKFCITDERFSADRISPFRDSLSEGERANIPDLLRDLGYWMVFNDPPLHTRLRGLANQRGPQPDRRRHRLRVHAQPDQAGRIPGRAEWNREVVREPRVEDLVGVVAEDIRG